MIAPLVIIAAVAAGAVVLFKATDRFGEFPVALAATYVGLAVLTRSLFTGDGLLAYIGGAVAALGIRYLPVAASADTRSSSGPS